ncbi:MAG: thiosulfate oxidation carrier protein SoxY [Rhodospirillales bacterium]|jgi:sulfur-oxidizing protein SoxY|nr:thiosulfate oxidation carrier protein SoxY [Rhodospirillales bacterium]
MKSLSYPDSACSRRKVLRAGARIAGLGAAIAAFGPMALISRPALAQAKGVQPEEELAQTMERLFGKRPIKDGAGMVEFTIPMIAENGSVVPARVEVKGAMGKGQYAKAIYIIADKNRRPLSAKYTFTQDAGGALVGTNLRLGDTSNVRAVVELSDGSLYQAVQEVRVTVGGCGG